MLLLCSLALCSLLVAFHIAELVHSAVDRGWIVAILCFELFLEEFRHIIYASDN